MTQRQNMKGYKMKENAKLNLLLVSIKLLYIEKRISDTSDKDIDSSNEVSLLLETMSRTDNGNGFMDPRSNDPLDDLIVLVSDMCNSKELGIKDKKEIKQILLITLGDAAIADKLIDDLDFDEHDIESMVKEASSLRRTIMSEKVRIDAGKMLSRAAFNLNKTRDISGFIDKLSAEIETMRPPTDLTELMSSEIDLGRSSDIEKIFEEERLQTKGALYSTGLSGLNVALDGGLRGGELSVLFSQQHQYKSGILRTKYVNIVRSNIPILINSELKPLSIYLSLEDNPRIIMRFFYQLLKSNDGIDTILAETTDEEASKYITEKLTELGWHVKILYINPDKLTYHSIPEMVEYYRSEGYEVKIMAIDYLSLIPKTGCTHTGVTGSDLRDLFRKIGNYTREEDILTMTVHQSGASVSALLKTGVTDKELLKLIAKKNYYEGSTQISQEIDVGMLGHLVPTDNGTYYHMGVDKHRGFVLDPDKQFFFYKFPNKRQPFPSDEGNKSSAVYKLPIENYDNIF